MTVSDESQQRGVEWLNQVLAYANLSATASSSSHPGEGEDETCWLEIDAEHLSEEQVQGLLGERGKVLDAMQYLANSVLNLGQDQDHQQPYIVEMAGYRVQRQAELNEIATTVAAKVRDTGEEVEIPDLSSAERRQMHTIFKETGGLETFSRGKEPDRRLVVKVSHAPESKGESSEIDA